MTGVEEYNYPAFNKAAADLRSRGHLVINPAEFFGGKADRTREEYMRESVLRVLEANEVMVLPGWDNSDGALLEVMIANQLGVPVSDYNPS
jgi:hypothetical protein